MDDHTPISQKLREDREREPIRETAEATDTKKIISGTATTKKKSGLTKFADVFISQDIEKVKSYIIMDVLIPTVKETILDTISMVLGVERGSSRGSKKPSPARTSYGRYYEREREQGVPYNKARVSYEFDDIILDNRGDAEDVLWQLRDDLKEFGTVSVLDLYDLVGVTGRHTDRNYGWTDLSTARVVPTSDGYLLRMPRALSIK